MAVNIEKAEVARLLAWLLTDPDEEMVEALKNRNICNLLSGYFESIQGKAPSWEGFLLGGDRLDLLNQMKSEYRRLFQAPGADDCWWVESIHKPWTNDPECRLSMAREKGHVMGDPALHMTALYRSMGMEVPEAFSGLPDHIVLELEFLAFLFERSLTEDAVKTFLNDHFDWVPDMVKRGKTYQPSSFYVSVLEAMERFIESEGMN